MLTNIYIEKVMKNIKGFIGVYSSNNIPILDKDDSSVIVNFDKINEPGSHFIAIYRKNSNKIIYFDSLNLKILPLDIAQYLSQYRHIFDLSKQIQSVNSTYCGFFCILFILAMNVSENYWNNIHSKFKSGDLKNDNKCIELICKTYNQFYK